MSEKIENKAELIEAARLAYANPLEAEFWAEVAAHLDQGSVKVEPRDKREK